MILMLMIASFASGVLAVLLALSIGDRSTLFISIPGFVIGAFFAVRYATFDRSRMKQEEHKRNRNRHKH
jgi:hypothetical protein